MNDVEHMLEHGESSFKALAGERLFITGGTGFFGRWLLEGIGAANKALGTGMRVTVLTRGEARRDGYIDFHHGDVRMFKFPHGSFGAVIHAAGPLSDEGVFDPIVNGTRRVVELARGAPMLFVSSGAVYGESGYGKAKRAAELLCPMAKIARCFSFVGPHMRLDGHFAAGNFLRDAAEGRDISVQDGAPIRSYMHMADLVVWLLTILVKGKGAYDVGSSEEVSIADLAVRIARLAGVGVVTNSMGQAYRYVPDISRARELGLEVRIGLDEALGRTYQRMKEEGSNGYAPKSNARSAS